MKERWGKTVAVCYGGIEIMYPTLFPILVGEKVQRILSSDFSTHLVPLQKHSLVVRHFTHSGLTQIPRTCTCVRGAGERRGEKQGEEEEEVEKEGMRKRRSKGRRKDRRGERREEEEWEEKGEEGRREAEGVEE